MAQQLASAEVGRIIQFILEIEKLKGVLRKVRPIGVDRYENTAEHSWQIALFAMSLADVLDLKIDVNRVVAMLLVHDLGEIDAGDKFVFAHEGWEESKAAELKALERICGLTPRKTCDFLVSLWKYSSQIASLRQASDSSLKSDEPTGPKLQLREAVQRQPPSACANE
jgi:putative hydrolases of HD superfamily